MRYGDLTYLEIRELAQAGAVAIVPCGRLHPQGVHLPVDLDVWLADVLCQAAAERALAAYQITALVLPALAYGPVPEHPASFGGTVHIPDKVHAALMTALLGSLAAQGFQRILIWRGCELGHLDDVVGAFNARYAGQSRAVLPAQPFREAWCALGDPAGDGDALGNLATSVALYMRPEDVRKELIAEPGCALPDAESKGEGASGAAFGSLRATAALGRVLWASLVERLVEVIAETAAGEVA